MKKNLLFGLLILGLGFTACKKDNASSTTTHLSVRMTDAPELMMLLY
jgi:hypothetical protein